MAAGNEKPEEKKPDIPLSERSLRDNAEEQLVHSPKHSPELKGKTSEQFIYELQVHQIELETQAEELRRAHLALEESRDKFLDLYDFAPTGYLTLTDKVLIADVNLAGATLLGVERRKLVNTRFRKFIAPEFFEQWDQYFVNILKQEKKQTCTLTIKRSDGSTVPARMEGIRLTGSDGAITVRVAVSDITDIWQIEALKSEYSILNGILESTDAAVFSLDRKYRYTNFNSHHAMVMKQLYGADIEPGHSIFDYQTVKEDQVQAKHNIDRALAGEHVMEEAFSGEEGRSRRYFEVTHYPIKDTGKKVIGVAVFAQDITGRKRVEQELARKHEELNAAYEQLTASEEELQVNYAELATSQSSLRETTNYLNNLLDYANAPIIVWDPSLRITRFNHAFERLTGRTSTEVLGQTLEILFPPQSREHSLELIKKTMSGERWETVDIPILHLNGSIRTVLWNSATLLAEDQTTVIATIAQGYDITERKLAEDALVRVNQKLNVITNLTRQDLTIQLFVLKSYLEITQKNAAGQDRILESIQKCEKAILSINEITDFTKDFQDMGAKPPQWQNVKMTLLFGLSHISIGNIQHSLETENLEIFADPLLEKVSQRLFENSVKHGGHVTRIRVSHMGTSDGATIVLEDDGIGIPHEKKEQIFLRSDGTRASMRSLIFVREILDITGITITENGVPGKGARFEITVPKGAWRISRDGT